MVKVRKYEKKDGTKVSQHTRHVPKSDLKYGAKNYSGIKKESSKKESVSMKKMIKSPIDDFKKDVLTERDVALLMRRINSGKIKPKDLFEAIPLLDSGEGLGLTKEQQEKGRKWLVNQWKTPSGVERKNNPFGYREQDVLENFKEIRLRDFYSERGNYYYPYYEVIGGDSSFEYYVSGGQVHILG